MYSLSYSFPLKNKHTGKYAYTYAQTHAHIHTNDKMAKMIRKRTKTVTSMKKHQEEEVDDKH